MRTYVPGSKGLMTNFCVKYPEAEVPLGTFVWEKDARLFASAISKKLADGATVEVLRIPTMANNCKVLYSKGELL